MMKDYPPAYWDKSYKSGKLGWDIGYAATPLKEYFDQLIDKSIRILVPGAGNGWEVEYLYNFGFKNTYLLDFAPLAIESFKKRFPDFPETQILYEDFFKHKGRYDLIVELAFFSSLTKNRRNQYVTQVYNLLKAGGKFVGLLFNHEFPFDNPPFGGSPEEYRQLFEKKFGFIHFDTAYNSIKPRKGREQFILLKKEFNMY
jgi:thiopurine S-methyltransferase